MPKSINTSARHNACMRTWEQGFFKSLLLLLVNVGGCSTSLLLDLSKSGHNVLKDSNSCKLYIMLLNTFNRGAGSYWYMMNSCVCLLLIQTSCLVALGNRSHFAS